MSSELDKNLAIELAENVEGFLQPAESSDAELVRRAVEFTFELTPEQNFVLLQLEMLAEDSLVPETERTKIKNFCSNYIKRKRYHDTKGYIMDIVRSLSWRHFAESGAMSGSINKSEQR